MRCVFFYLLFLSTGKFRPVSASFHVREGEIADALSSPKSLQQLYQRYRVSFPEFGVARTGTAKNRLNIFQKTLLLIEAANKKHSWQSGINFLTALTKEERRQYLGLNISRVFNNLDVIEDNGIFVDDSSNARQKRSTDGGVDWRAEGKVTGIKQQGKCGACWAFASAGVLETSYAILIGKRKQFSEQELLDCTYDQYFMGSIDQSKVTQNSCVGGFYTMAWHYMRTENRLALHTTAPYTGNDGSCSYKKRKVADGLKSAKVNTIHQIKTGEMGIMRALQSRAVAVGFEVTDDFNMYAKGIFKDETCVGEINHAVVAVGYTPKAMICKNSWGDWGDKGYIYVARFHHGCQIYDYPYYIKLKNTGIPDTDPEYVPVDGGSGCVDKNADGCPCGTVRCSSGECKHVHMC